MSRVFAHGGLRLYLLLLLGEEPRHGYELIRLLEDRFMGLYTPSAGTIYPRLAALEDDGLVEHEVVDGRKVYRLTDGGRGRARRPARRDRRRRGRGRAVGARRWRRRSATRCGRACATCAGSCKDGGAGREAGGAAGDP